MMDHGYFEGPWRGGFSGGTPYIFTQAWYDYLAKKKKEKQKDEHTNGVNS